MDKVMTMLKKGSGNLFEKFVVGGMVLMTIGGYNGYNVDTVETADLFEDSGDCTLQQTPLPFANEFRYKEVFSERMGMGKVLVYFLALQ